MLADEYHNEKQSAKILSVLFTTWILILFYF